METGDTAGKLYRTVETPATIRQNSLYTQMSVVAACSLINGIIMGADCRVTFREHGRKDLVLIVAKSSQAD
jgi:hypothetical protein